MLLEHHFDTGLTNTEQVAWIGDESQFDEIIDEWSLLDCCDCSYALVSEEFYIKWLQYFKSEDYEEIVSAAEDDYFAVSLVWQIDNGYFILVTDSECGTADDFYNMCIENKIECQMHVNCPYIDPDVILTLDENGVCDQVYTGSTTNYLHLLTLWQKLQQA